MKFDTDLEILKKQVIIEALLELKMSKRWLLQVDDDGILTFPDEVLIQLVGKRVMI
jgi:hypothetical protein